MDLASLYSRGLSGRQCLQWAAFSASGQRRWRHHPKGGRYGPAYTHFPLEIKVQYPPKDRSRLMLLPDSKRIMFVTNGWYYPDKRKAENNKVWTPVLTFASVRKHNNMDSLTAAELAVFEKLIPEFQRQFDECKKRLAEEEAMDAAMAHECR
mmetsp:Transcript_91964/g.213753  ORF Transcript_91964/g.213753 Transcript_91964/m.213753 type:complete len:152 (-) Transcript_91964:85-540(-)